jgi:flavin-dependent dehydrogenase
VTADGVSIAGAYPGGCRGRAVERRRLDPWLLGLAIDSGATFEGGVVVRHVVVGDRRVEGIAAAGSDPASTRQIEATVTIAADGRASATGRSAGLTRYRATNRRWAFGGYATGVVGAPDWGEMHVRSHLYVGVAPVGPGRFNVCAATGRRPVGQTPREVLERVLADDPALADRFAGATFEPGVRAIGPLGVEAMSPGRPGLLLAGDAAGFVDPMTGDGLHLALRGAVLAATEASRVLEDGDHEGAVRRLARARRDAFGAKLRFNRTLVRLTASPTGVAVAARVASAAPAIVRWLVARAGDAA